MKLSKQGWMMGLLAVLLVSALPSPGASHFEVGVGANYWVAIEDAVEDSFDEDGIGWMISTRYMATPFIGVGLELERSPDNYVQFDEPIYCPAAYLIVGKGLYAALGVGTYFYDGEFYEDVFYALRAGIKAELLPSIILDINVNYRVDEWSGIRNVDDDIDTDNVILGAALRLKF